MTRAVAYRLPEDLVGRIRVAAAEANLSATEYVRQAIETRLSAPPLTALPMTEGEASVMALWEADRSKVSRDTCAHPFRNEFGVCRACGTQL